MLGSLSEHKGGWLKDLWRKTRELFGKYPVLWLPVLVADLVKFLLEFPRHWMTRSVVRIVVEPHHSVLGTTPDPASRSSVFWASVMSAPFTWDTYFIDICLYTAAFVVTAALVRMALQNQQPKIAAGLRSLTSKILSGLGLSLKVFVLYVIAAMYFGFLLTVLSKIIDPRSFPSTVPILASVIVGFLVAYFIAPCAVRLLLTKDSPSLVAKTHWTARAFAILAMLASVLLSVFCQRAELSLMRDGSYLFGAARLITDAGASLLTVLPYIPLFVVLSLIAFRGSATNDMIDMTS